MFIIDWGCGGGGGDGDGGGDGGDGGGGGDDGGDDGGGDGGGGGDDGDMTCVCIPVLICVYAKMPVKQCCLTSSAQAMPHNAKKAAFDERAIKV